MKPRPPPSSGLHLELKLGSLIGFGRGGHVYSVDIVNISHTPHPNAPSSLPLFEVNVPDLCIKLAEPDKPRSIAREAWLYEQLDAMGLQGVAVPRTYGFFTAHCSPSQVIPWGQESWHFRKDGREVFSKYPREFDCQSYEPESHYVGSFRDDEHKSNQRTTVTQKLS